MKFEKSLKSLLVGSLLATTIVGCTTTNRYGYSGDTELSQYSVLDIISQESQKASQATQMLAKYKQTQTELITIKHENFDNEKIMLDYIGKPPVILYSIALKYGYRFLETGTNCNHLPTLNFNKYYTTPKDSLSLIDAQLGETASIHLNKDEKIITLSCKM